MSAWTGDSAARPKPSSAGMNTNTCPAEAFRAGEHQREQCLQAEAFGSEQRLSLPRVHSEINTYPAEALHTHTSSGYVGTSCMILDQSLLGCLFEQMKRPDKTSVRKTLPSITFYAIM